MSEFIKTLEILGEKIELDNWYKYRLFIYNYIIIEKDFLILNA